MTHNEALHGGELRRIWRQIDSIPKPSQTDFVLKQLLAGRTVTRLTAMHLGIAQINEIIRRGRERLECTPLDIETRQKRDGFGRRYAEYVLVWHDTREPVGPIQDSAT